MIRRTCPDCKGRKIVWKGAVNVAAFPMLAGNSDATTVRCTGCRTSGYQVTFTGPRGPWYPGTPQHITI